MKQFIISLCLLFAMFATACSGQLEQGTPITDESVQNRRFTLVSDEAVESLTFYDFDYSIGRMFSTPGTPVKYCQYGHWTVDKGCLKIYLNGRIVKLDLNDEAVPATLTFPEGLVFVEDLQYNVTVDPWYPTEINMFYPFN